MKKIVLYDKQEGLDAGIPEGLLLFIDERSLDYPDDLLKEKMARQIVFWKNNPNRENEFKRYWKVIKQSAKSPNDLNALFLEIPDGLLSRPFPYNLDKRVIDSETQRNRYDHLISCIDEISALFKRRKIKRPKKFRSRSDNSFTLFLDAYATSQEALQKYSAFEYHREEFVNGLIKLRILLKAVDPSAKDLTKHWKSKDAALHNYIVHIAGLNRFLDEPRHSALAMLAEANNPSVLVSKDSITKAWKRSADKSFYF